MGYFEEHTEKIQLSSNSQLCQVFGAAENANVSIALVKMNEGKMGVYHYHDNITERYVFAKGNGRIRINGIENEIFPGDIYDIPPKNAHTIITDSRMEFECICTPPWEEEHEFVISEEKVVSNCIIKKKEIFPEILKIKDDSEIAIEKLNKKKSINKIIDDGYVEVYYFLGIGKIKINNIEKDIHNGECFLIEPNSTIQIYAESDMIVSKVKEKMK